MNRLLLLLCLGCAVAPDGTPDLQLDRVAEAMRMPGVHVTVRWQDCGEVNAFYSSVDDEVFGVRIPAHSVTMCNELRTESPGFVRYVLAHELSHAIIDQRGIPFTGSEEVAADELAAVVFGVYGWQTDFYATAERYRQMADVWVPPWDPHPQPLVRAFTLGCMAAESEGKYPVFCDPTMYQRALRSWMVLLDL